MNDVRGEIWESKQLEDAVRRKMHVLMEASYEGVTWEQFTADLEQKDRAILLVDEASGGLQGFSTIQEMHIDVRSEPAIVLFSGDTIVEEQARGDAELARLWMRQAFDVADAHPDQRTFWFLICSGYKTYRVLSVFCREFVPHHDTSDPALSAILHEIASQRFSEAYDPNTGIIRLPHPTPLRPGVADVTPERLRDPHVAYFVERNPGHLQGDELACLTEVTRENLTRAGRRILEAT